ncbi:MAG: GIY-YIG nuclease family protein [bacterium]|nr:GIY-YIG nuclease family protein [bacterium]
MGAFIYILKSINHPRTYVGSTANIQQRITEHNSGKSTYTKRYLPWMLVYTEEFGNIEDARKRERYLKSAAGRRFIKKLNIIPR